VTRPVRLIVVLALLGLALPAAAVVVRDTLHFKATFDSDSSTDNGIPSAEVGSLTQTSGAPGAFTIVAAPAGGGWLRAAGSGGAASMEAGLNPPYIGQTLVLSLSQQCSQTSAAFRFSVADDNDSGMIDLEWGDDGWLYVDHEAVMSYAADTPYDVELLLSDPMMGASTWNLTVSWNGPGGPEVVEASGPLALASQLHVVAVEMVREASAVPVEFFVDDLKAISASYGLK
jgi:hypothetical protein